MREAPSDGAPINDAAPRRDRVLDHGPHRRPAHAGGHLAARLDRRRRRRGARSRGPSRRREPGRRSSSSARRSSARRVVALAGRSAIDLRRGGRRERTQTGACASASCRPARARRGATAASPTSRSPPRSGSASGAPGADADGRDAIRASIEGARRRRRSPRAATGQPAYAQLARRRAREIRDGRRGRRRDGRVLPPEAAPAREQPARPRWTSTCRSGWSPASSTYLRRQTVKGDFTRVTFEPREALQRASACSRGACSSTPTGTSRRRSSRYLERTEATDVIGRGGAPKQAATSRSPSLRTAPTSRSAPGRMYVEGVLCELDAERYEIASFPSATRATLADVARRRRAPAAGQLDRARRGRHPRTLNRVKSVERVDRHDHARRGRRRLRGRGRPAAAHRHDVPRPARPPGCARADGGPGRRPDATSSTSTCGSARSSAIEDRSSSSRRSAEPTRRRACRRSGRYASGKA